MNRNFRHALRRFAFAGALALLAACGDGSSSREPPPPEPPVDPGPQTLVWGQGEWDADNWN